MMPPANELDARFARAVNAGSRSRLTVDFRIDPRSEHEPSADDQYLAFHEIAAAAKRPQQLARMLWARPRTTVEVVEDGITPSGVQALAQVLLALIRTERFRLVTPEGHRDVTRMEFVRRALARAARAIPTELARTAFLALGARRAAQRDYGLERAAANPANVTYLRLEPTLHWLGNYVGGAATHTTGVINGFSANGVDVRVFAAESPGDLDAATIATVPLERVYHLVGGLTFTDFSRAVARAAESKPTDFVYQRYAMGSFAGLELARRWGVPLVLEFNGSDIWVMEHWGPRKPRLLKTLSALERRNLTDASLVVVVSDVLRDHVIEQGVSPDRVLVNPNGVDVARLARLRERSPAEWRTALGRPEAITVGFIGTFGPWHGVKLLPELIARVGAARPEVRWILIGDGHLYGEVREEIAARGLEEKVFMTGLIDHERALELLAASDVCVSPHVPNPDGSRFFGSPTKLFEYMGLGKPIVASDLEQIGEVIRDGQTGLLGPPGDVAAAAEAVVRLVDDDALRDRLGAAALEDAGRNYSWAAHTRRILVALEAGGVTAADTVEHDGAPPVMN